MQFTPNQGHMGGRLYGVAGFPGDEFALNLPECIGDTARVLWGGDFGTIQWLDVGGAWAASGRVTAEASFRMMVVPGVDTLDIDLQLVNESNRTWASSMAFNCFASANAPSVRDFELVRHHVGLRGDCARLHPLPRLTSARPGIQVYGVSGAPAIADIPFAAAFKATAPFGCEDWLAVRSRDDRRLVAAVSKPALFLFQNCEFSCIHACPSFGRLAPGESGEALTRLYFVEDSLRGWYQRMRAELG